MKHLDIVELTKNNWRGDEVKTLCVCMMITPKMINRGLFDTTRPGLHLVRGYWYGKDPTNIRCYGKNEGFASNKRSKVIGRVTTHQELMELGFD